MRRLLVLSPRKAEMESAQDVVSSVVVLGGGVVLVT